MSDKVLSLTEAYQQGRDDEAAALEPILQDLIEQLRELDVALSERGQAIPALRISRINAERRLREVQDE